ncbi:MAG TPA: DUF1614 domain-containing protein [Gammaproteobacteria bacterium]|nr:DUF1614 domain-containing protein [Gammaproteobacteria bacterium]
MRPSFSPLHLLLFVVLLVLLLAFVQVGLLTVAFDKLGLSASSGFLLLYASLFGSMINLPLATIDAHPPPQDQLPRELRGLLRQQPRPFTGRTVIALNVGGGLIPVMFSAYLMAHNPLGAGEVLLGVGLVTAVSYGFSRPIPGLGIGMPILIAPIGAALAAVLISPQHSPPLAYISGTLGVLIGADLLRVKDIKHLGAPVASIGGAGTFDGIFVTGIVAVLLA